MTTISIPLPDVRYRERMDRANRWLLEGLARLRTGAEGERAKRVTREPIIVVDRDAYWYASLPISEMQDLDWRARYVAASTSSQWWGLGIGLVVGTVLVMAGFWFVLNLNLGEVFVKLVFVGMLFGAAPGAVTGFIVALVWFVGQPLWILRRKNDGLEPVVPRELLQDYDTRGKPFVIRADIMSGIREQQAVKSRFRRVQPSIEKMELASVILLVLALGAILFLLNAMTQNAGG